MSGFLFLIVMDCVMRRAVGGGENGIRWKFTSKLDDLDFSSTKQQIQDKTAGWMKRPDGWELKSTN